MKTESPVDRRTFIKSAALLGGLSALLGICGPVSAQAKNKKSLPVNPCEPSGKGYQLTEHVKRYYETARL